MTCETTVKSSILEGLEYALAMVMAADETISAAEKDEITKIVETPFFAELAARIGIAPVEMAQSIIKRAEALLNANENDLYDIFMSKAFSAIRNTVTNFDGDGKEVILAAINSLAAADELSAAETEIIAMIIDIMNA